MKKEKKITDFVKGSRATKTGAFVESGDGFAVFAASVDHRLVNDVADRQVQRHRFRCAIHCTTTKNIHFNSIKSQFF